MKGKLSLVFFLICLSINCSFAQVATSPYKTSWLKDGALTAAGIGASVVGGSLINNKDRLTQQNLLNLTKADVNGFDRFAAGNYSTSAETVSDFPFYGSFLTPFLLLLDEDIKQNAPQVFLLYGQTMSLAGGLYSLTAGLSRRKRPYIYADDAPLSIKTDKQATNSFYAGHTAATAAATFFVAKVYHDFNPDSPARPYIWATAAVVPVAVGYLRIRAGKHFLSDNIVGYAVGAGLGILVPELHRRSKKANYSLLPVAAPEYNGAMFNYIF
ncbi:phosphatase PAP2 family protein [Pontibacter cellulosilyticus]|uniref:Phosphatase PAP2 family protein n=1 Tax=Pontibacter cellulosilyticus TaxID=1720253 RepID=A0A923SIQ6_9BACT|nr:phosphatase PAP2 family protein [Pontibacter cellulosilyticus]MBC5992857.1 phosphatase PAP2 family protein [Pontibacter cellulosilyticus]